MTEKLESFEDLETKLNGLPMTWYPAVLAIVAEAAIRKNVFVRGGLVTHVGAIAKRVEAAVFDGDDAAACPKDSPGGLAEALVSAANTMAFSAQDWAQHHRDAWLWGILCGWDRGALAECIEKFGWTDEAVERLRRYRSAVKEVTGDAD